MITNNIKCRYCTWTTRKFGHDSTMDKAFARLRGHIEAMHENVADQMAAAKEASEAREAKMVSDLWCY